VTGTVSLNPVIYTAEAALSASSGPPFNIVITANPTITLVGTTSAITAQITDLYGNPIVNGTTVSFSSTLVGSNIFPASTGSSNGIANASLTSSQPGATTVIVEAGSISQTTAVTFTSPSLAIEKTASPSPIPPIPGELLVYTIIVSNTGNSILNNVVITDYLSLESRTQFVSANPSGVNVNNNRVFNLGNFSPGMTQTVMITVQLLSSASEGDTLSNIVQTKADETVTVQDTVFVPVAAEQISVSKSLSPNPVMAGGVLTYTITYANNGAFSTANLRLTDTLPSSITIVNVDEGNAALVFSSATSLVFTQSTLAGGAQDAITITGRVLTAPWPAEGASLVNQVALKTDSSESPITSQASVLVRPAEAASLVIAASAIITPADKPIAITATVKDQYGNPAYNGESVTFESSSSNTTIPSPQTTSDGAASALLQAINPITTTTTVTATVGGNVSDSIQVTFTKPPIRYSYVYLPLILKQAVPAIDLVVDTIEVVPANPNTGQPVVITVTIRNSDTLATSTDFWVDLYITTEPVTPEVNQPWNEVGLLGVAWVVPGIQGDEVITLTNLNPDNYSDPNDCTQYSNFTPETVGNCTWIRNSNTYSTATTYYVTALVDSFGEGSQPEYGNVIESNENNNVYPTPVHVPVVGASLQKTYSRSVLRAPLSIVGQSRLPLRP